MVTEQARKVRTLVRHAPAKGDPGKPVQGHPGHHLEPDQPRPRHRSRASCRGQWRQRQLSVLVPKISGRQDRLMPILDGIQASAWLVRGHNHDALLGRNLLGIGLAAFSISSVFCSVRSSLLRFSHLGRQPVITPLSRELHVAVRHLVGLANVMRLNGLT
jgi:hypothetical protein